MKKRDQGLNVAFSLVYIASFVFALWTGCKSGEMDDPADTGKQRTEKDAGADSADDDGAGQPTTPVLKPINVAEAERLGAYTRKLKFSVGGNVSRPVAWSMINVCCQDRTAALSYALAAADPSLTGSPRSMVDSELTVEFIEALAEDPSFELGTINVAGPLITFQTLRGLDSVEMVTKPFQYYWSFHHAVAINVDGEMRVLDLSIGDEPVAIDDWLSAFVEPSIRCRHSSDAVYHQVRNYWMTAFSDVEPPDEPKVLCAYTITPIFTFRRDRTARDFADYISTVPLTMDKQLGLFKKTLLSIYGISVAEDVLPNITSNYRPGTVRDFCDSSPMKFCDRM